MFRKLAVVVGCGAVTVSCSGSLTGPTNGGRARLSQTRFVAFGDSLTTGEVTMPVGAMDLARRQVVVPSAAYPAVLESQLRAAYPSQAGAITVVNEGKGGENVVDGILRFEDALESSRATVVLFQEGINSLGYPGIETATTLTRSMVIQARNRGAKMFVGSMLPSPAGRQRSQNAAALVAFNDLLRAMSVQEGATFVDLYNGMLPQAETLIGVDGLHPTEAGYRRIAEIFFAAIRTELEER